MAPEQDSTHNSPIIHCFRSCYSHALLNPGGQFLSLISRVKIQVSEENPLNVLIFVLLLFLYILLLYFFGFLLSTPFIIFFVMLILRGHNLKKLISISVIVSFVIYYLCFYLMRIMLPTGAIFD